MSTGNTKATTVPCGTTVTWLDCYVLTPYSSNACVTLGIGSDQWNLTKANASGVVDRWNLTLPQGWTKEWKPLRGLKPWIKQDIAILTIRDETNRVMCEIAQEYVVT